MFPVSGLLVVYALVVLVLFAAVIAGIAAVIATVVRALDLDRPVESIAVPSGDS